MIRIPNHSGPQHSVGETLNVDYFATALYPDAYKLLQSAVSRLRPQDSPGDPYSQEVGSNRYAGYETAWAVEHERLHRAGIARISEVERPLRQRLREEFESSGVYVGRTPYGAKAGEVDDEATTMFEHALTSLTEELAATKDELGAMKRRFQTQVSYFFAHGLTTEDVEARMSEALGDALIQVRSNILGAGRGLVGRSYPQAISTQEEAPSRPKYSLWNRGARTAYDRVQEAQVRSIGRIISNIMDGDQVVADFFASAKAYFLRSVYGHRELILDMGFESDPTDQIDKFQKQHFDSFGGRYIIALTPEEWVNRHLDASVRRIIFGVDSPVSQFLDLRAQSRDEWSRSRREDRRRLFGVGAEQDQREEDLRFRARTSSAPIDESRFSHVAASPNWTDLQREAFVDMLSLVDSRLNGAVAPSHRSRIIVVLKDVLGRSGSIDERFVPASTSIRVRLLRKAIAELHPDRVGENEECKYLTRLLADLIRESKADHQ